ncbi:MAG TPA: nuclear transport factor 2 family protein [Chthonomonadaceae bacterium]|nr:nuclear transport factor 2 family protein [Chthonomonadaceae bacterium]
MRIAALALLLSVIMAGTAAADDVKDIRSTYDKFCAAIIHQNFAAIRALETPDFTAQEGGRKLNGKQEEAVLRQQFSTKGKVRFMRVLMRGVSVRGKTAEVVTDFWYQAIVPVQAGTGKPHRYDRSGSISNTLVKTASGWKFKTLTQTTLSIAVDGQRTNPQGNGGKR